MTSETGDNVITVGKGILASSDVYLEGARNLKLIQNGCEQGFFSSRMKEELFLLILSKKNICFGGRGLKKLQAFEDFSFIGLSNATRWEIDEPEWQSLCRIFLRSF